MSLIIVPFALYVLLKGRRDLRQANVDRKSVPLWRKALVRIVLSAAVFVLGSNLYFQNFNVAKGTGSLGNWWNLSVYNITGGLGFHGYDIYRYAKLNWLDAETVTAEQVSEAQLWIEDRGKMRGSLEQDGLFGTYKGSNVLMVQVEALQSFMFGKSIGGEEITPNLNKLITESAYFEQFYHQTAQGRTSDADFAANCSLQPAKSGAVFNQYSGNEFDCLPQTLKNLDYSANVFHPYQGGFWNRNVMYDKMNYDFFYSLKHFKLDEKVGWAVGDKSFYRQSMDVIADSQKPFYAFLITLTSHHPYSMPAAEKKLDVEELEGTIMGNYLQSVHYADSALGELIERMKTEGLWDNTIFIMYGDHDNSIKDWELYKTFLGKSMNELDQHMMSKEIPLLIHLPDGKHAGNYSQPGGQVDIAPTILHLLGVSTENMYMLGTPLLTGQPLEDRLVVQRNGSWTDGSVYYLPSGDGVAANGRCYTITTGALADINSCVEAAEKANTELLMSDHILMNNLIKEFKKQSTVEAIETRVIWDASGT